MSLILYRPSGVVSHTCAVLTVDARPVDARPAASERPIPDQVNPAATSRMVATASVLPIDRPIGLVRGIKNLPAGHDGYPITAGRKRETSPAPDDSGTGQDLSRRARAAEAARA